MACSFGRRAGWHTLSAWCTCTGLSEWVDGMFDKDPRVKPYPDFIIDDDWYLVEKYGGHCVSQYKAINPDDREFEDALFKLAELGHM